MLPVSKVGIVAVLGRITTPFSGSFTANVVRAIRCIGTASALALWRDAATATATTIANAAKRMTRFRTRFIASSQVGDGALRAVSSQRDAQLHDGVYITYACHDVIVLRGLGGLLCLEDVVDRLHSGLVLQLCDAGRFRS